MSDRSRQWLAWAFILTALPLSWLVIRSGPTGGPEIPEVEPPMMGLEASSVRDPASGRAESEHELAALAQELDKNPDHAPVLIRMAELSRELGRPADAVAHLEAALEVEPGNAEARLELGRALYESGDLAGAIRETQWLVETDPSDVDALYNLGAIYGNMGDEELAREYWQRAVGADSESESGRLAARALAGLSAENE